MESAYWSLRNKLEDIERALTQGSNVSARMAAHELSIRLCHTTTALQLGAEGMDCAHPSMTDGQARLGLLSRFGAELDRLIVSLRQPAMPRRRSHAIVVWTARGASPRADLQRFVPQAQGRLMTVPIAGEVGNAFFIDSRSWMPAATYCRQT